MISRSICLLLLLSLAISVSYGAETSTCLTVYEEGGAPAVYLSPRCPRWTLFHEEDRGQGSRYDPVSNCHLTMHQGRRKSQEDRAVCAFGIRIPFIGKNYLREEVSVGVVAVFDGHNGAEASEMASQLFLDYFYLHVYFLLNGEYSYVFQESSEMFKSKVNSGAVLLGVSQHSANSVRSRWTHSKPYDMKILFEILRESLIRAIHDIDATFTKEASRKSLESGTTATIVLIVEGQILVANVGDSKAVLCSESHHSVCEYKGKNAKVKRRRNKNANPSNVEKKRFDLMNHVGLHFCAKELTKDHHPDNDGERKRVEDAGGFVEDWAGVSRVNGELAVSRAIGDVPYKRYGVISTPEVTDWLPLYNNDSYLVVASDGIFEKLTVQEVCDLLREATLGDIDLIVRKHDLSGLLVKTALERGSMDNMAAIVIPLARNMYSPKRDDNECGFEECADSSHNSVVKRMKSDDHAVASTSLISMEYFSQIETKFQKLLVKADRQRAGCFYLAEDLNEHSDYIFRAPTGNRTAEHNEIIQYSPEGLNYDASTWPLNFYGKNNICWDIDLNIGENVQGQCVNPESFMSFLGLVSSIPVNESGSYSQESFNQKNSDFRYKLKRKFDRGSYGEVWLAFHWNCSTNIQENVANSSSPLHAHEGKSGNDPDSSNRDNFFGSSDNDYFILKRIMVERGNAAYLSGLREKYYGEIFANASKSLEKAEEDVAFFTNLQHDSCSIQYAPAPSTSGSQRADCEEGLTHIARFIESFTSKSKEIWLVFRHEGTSLSKLLYTVDGKKILSNNDGDQMASNVQVLQPSVWWNWLRTTEAGKKEMRNIIRQLILAIKSLHKRGITHRDIKPENMIVCFEDTNTGKCERAIPAGQNLHRLKMRIIDFGSAIDAFTLESLYGSGPSRSEQTYEYMPPEALLNNSWFRAQMSTRQKYDMWSVGVVFMELILGSPHVFQISDRTRAILDQHLEGWGDNMKELAYKLRSLMELCILIPGLSYQHRSGDRDHESGSWPASWKCTEEFFATQVRNRDPLKLGFPNIWALRLVRQLLAWNPEERLSADDALRHPYFESDL